MTSDLIMMAITLAVTLMFLRTAMNKIYPNLFGKLLKFVRVTVLLTLKIIAWPITTIFSRIFPINSPEKKLPGRKR
jgi:hypothetical protein